MEIVKKWLKSPTFNKVFGFTRQFLRAILWPVLFVAGSVFIYHSQHNPQKNAAVSSQSINSELNLDCSTSDCLQKNTDEAVVTDNMIISDFDNRISPELKVPEILKKRVNFWFDIYTKHDSKVNVIHHAKYPWVIFAIHDSSDIYNTNLHKWTKYHRAKNRLKKTKANIKKSLQRLARRKSYRELKGLDLELYNKLKTLKGSRKSVFRTAAQNIRSQLGQKNFFLSALDKSEKYLPFMEQEFARKNLPHELSRIPFVESSFNLNAHSRVGAVGIWQIMPQLRTEIRIDKKIDERLSPFKSTLHAVKHLKRNYKIIKSWPMAIVAYNLGVGNARKLIKKYKTSNIATLISRAKGHRFGFAAKNFYPSFLAAMHAEKYKNYIFGSTSNNDVEPIKSFKLSSRITVNQLLSKLNMSKELFYSYNLDLKNVIESNARLPRGLVFFVPKSFVDSNKSEIAEARKSLGLKVRS